MNAESVPPSDLRRLALFHRWQILAAIAMILAVSCWILARDVPGVFPDSVSPRLLEGIFYVLLTAVWVLSVILCFLLFALPASIVVAILACVPGLNLIVWLVVNSRGTRRLRAAGARVGFFGASRKSIEALV